MGAYNTITELTTILLFTLSLSLHPALYCVSPSPFFLLPSCFSPLLPLSPPFSLHSPSLPSCFSCFSELTPYRRPGPCSFNSGGCNQTQLCLAVNFTHRRCACPDHHVLLATTNTSCVETGDYDLHVCYCCCYGNR